MAFTVDQVVGKYVELRDQQRLVSERHAEEMKPFNEALQNIEAWLLGHFNANGIESAKTKHGTAYKSTTMSATVENWDELFKTIVSSAFIRALSVIEEGGNDEEAFARFCSSERLSLLVRGVNKTAVKEYMDMTCGAVPPGVKTTFITKCNVRRT